jgi:hypothetical protein
MAADSCVPFDEGWDKLRLPIKIVNAGLGIWCIKARIEKLSETPL